MTAHLFSDEKTAFMASAAVVTIALMGSIGVITQKVLGEWFLRQAVYPHDDICEMPETYKKKKAARMHPTRFLRAAVIMEVEKALAVAKMHPSKAHSQLDPYGEVERIRMVSHIVERTTAAAYTRASEAHSQYHTAPASTHYFRQSVAGAHSSRLSAARSSERAASDVDIGVVGSL
jgi:hypothetical protein